MDTNLCGKPLVKVNPYTGARSRGETCAKSAGHNWKCQSEAACQQQAEYARRRRAESRHDDSRRLNWLRYNGLIWKDQTSVKASPSYEATARHA